MAMRPRMKHTVDISHSPNGGYNLFLDGEEIAEETVGFELKYDSETRELEALITRRIIVDKLSAEGVDVVTMAAPNPWEG